MISLLQLNKFRIDGVWRTALKSYKKIEPIVLGGITFIERKLADENFMTRTIDPWWWHDRVIQFSINGRAFFTEVLSHANGSTVRNRFVEGHKLGLSGYDLLGYAFETLSDTFFYEVTYVNDHKFRNKVGDLAALGGRLLGTSSLSNTTAITAGATAVAGAAAVTAAASVPSVAPAVLSSTASNLVSVESGVPSYASSAYNGISEFFSRHTSNTWNWVKKNPGTATVGGLVVIGIVVGAGLLAASYFMEPDTKSLALEPDSERSDTELNSEPSVIESGSERADNESDSILSNSDNSDESGSERVVELGSELTDEESGSERSVINSSSEDSDLESDPEPFNLDIESESSDIELDEESSSEEELSNIQADVNDICMAIANQRPNMAKILLESLKEAYSSEELERGYNIIARKAIYFSAFDILKCLITEPAFNPRDYVVHSSESESENIPVSLLGLAVAANKLDAFKILFEAILNTKNAEYTAADDKEVSGIITDIKKSKNTEFLEYLQTQQDNLTSEQRESINQKIDNSEALFTRRSDASSSNVSSTLAASARHFLNHRQVSGKKDNLPAAMSENAANYMESASRIGFPN